MSMMQCGIYLKYRKMANVRPVKSLHVRENVKISLQKHAGGRMPVFR